MIEKVKINKIKSNPKNPRLVRDEKFRKLVNSIKEFPEMLNVRPLIVDENFMILGGNMRWKACQQLGLKEVSIQITKGWTTKQKDEFIIKDNIGFGEWDWDILANDYDNKELKEWGLDVWQTDDNIELEDFFNDETNFPEDLQDNKIVLEYNKEDFDIVIAAFERHKVNDKKLNTSLEVGQNMDKEELVKTLLLYNIKI